MAAGRNSIKPRTAIAVLHGARGLTSALGAIADTRRSERPFLRLTGMASRASGPYLPPHAEPGLIADAGRFACAAVDASTLTGWNAGDFLDLVHAALAPAPGPVLLGVPHDVAATSFVPRQALNRSWAISSEPVQLPDLALAVAMIGRARRPLILIDDYLLDHGPAAEAALGRFAAAIAAPVLQLAYRRGPMLFQQAQPHLVPTLTGPYDPASPGHTSLMAQADLLITVEDRNMYPRVAGPLPPCRIIAITSRPDITRKNGYLTGHDLLLAADPGSVLRALAAAVTPAARPWTPGATASAPATSRSAETLAAAIASALGTVMHPLLVDDSQMLGGLIARHYKLFPASTRVLASHGGFIGSGLATAVGVASAGSPVLCLLGDQGFTNGVGALAVAAELAVPLVAIACDNGGSVSLRDQAAADDFHLGPLPASLLGNCEQMDYAAIAAGYGITATTVPWPDGPERAGQAGRDVRDALSHALTSQRPSLLHLITPRTPRFWSGIWNTAGFEPHDGVAIPDRI